MSDAIGDDDLLSLADASRLLFNGRLSKSSLRTEARKGNLEIIRIANKDFVTKSGVKRMIERCTITREPAARTDVNRKGMTAQEALSYRIAEMQKKSR